MCLIRLLPKLCIGTANKNQCCVQNIFSKLTRGLRSEELRYMFCLKIAANVLHKFSSVGKVIIDEDLFGWKPWWGNNHDKQGILNIGMQINGQKV
jgi:hypothetical protein